MKYLTKTETKMLLTSNYFSILYYNAEIWLSEGLHARQKQQILSASGNALKILENKSDIRISFLQRHRIINRATPMNFAKIQVGNPIIQNLQWDRHK